MYVYERKWLETCPLAQFGVSELSLSDNEDYQYTEIVVPPGETRPAGLQALEDLMDRDNVEYEEALAFFQYGELVNEGTAALRGHFRRNLFTTT